jgi:F-type H+-transporting ATPase subunit delta
MADARITSYADALLSVARAEGAVDQVTDQLVQVSQAFQANDDLRRILTDPGIPATTRQQVVEDVLSGSAHPVTTALASMIVGAGRAAELPEIVHALAEHAARDKGRTLAEVRTAVPLSEDQRGRLAEALGKAVGSPVELKVVIDPSVLGGVVAQIGDTVIDGSVRSRLNQVRGALV